MLRLGGLLLPLLLLITACDSSQQFGGTPDKKPVQTVVSLSPSNSELMGQYGEGLSLIGRTESCNYPDYIKSAAVVGEVKPDYEMITSLRPDIILYDASLYNTNDVAKIKELGIEAWPMDVSTVDEFIDYLHRTGTRLGKETRFSEYVDKIYAARKTAQSVVDNKDKKVAILLGMNDGAEFLIAGTNTFTADLIRASGATPVGPESKKFETANIERVIQLNPDVIFCGGNAEAVLNDKRLASVSAVKRRQVVDIDQDVMLRAGGRVNDFIKRAGDFLSTTD